MVETTELQMVARVSSHDNTNPSVTNVNLRSVTSINTLI